MEDMGVGVEGGKMVKKDKWVVYLRKNVEMNDE